MSEYDLIVIGGGPGGYVAAIRAAQLGMKVACVEMRGALGGTCLNVGCIPSKALLDSSEHFYNAGHTFAKHGIQIENLKADMPQMIARKNEVVSQTNSGVKFLMTKNKIEVYHGIGSFLDKNTVQVTDKDGKTIELKTKYSIIATGSKPSTLPNITIDKQRIITSTEALNLSLIHI